MTPKSMEEDRGASDTRNIKFTMVFLMICEIANHFDQGSSKDQGSIFAWSRPLGGALRSRSIRIDKKEGGTKALTRHGPKAWRI